MKYTINFNYGNLAICAECNNEDERKEAVHGIKFACEDLEDYIKMPKKKSDGPKMNPDDPATEKQKDYMGKLGIEYDKDITIGQASNLISEWKDAHEPF